MKTVLLSATLLGVCFSNLVLANTDENPIEFSVIPKISNISCGASSTNAIYTVINQEEHATIIVTPREIINHDDFPDNLVKIQAATEPGSLTTCDNTYLKSGETCNINLIIDPEDCASGTILGPIDRTLVVATGTQYKDPTAPIKFAYTTLGGADSFAILGNEVNSEISVGANGNVGHTTTGSFRLTNGGKIFDDSSDPAVVAAQNSFSSLFNQLLDFRVVGGCVPHGNFDPDDQLNPSTYCLNNTEQTEFLVNGPINLNGNGEFLFFIDNVNNDCFKNDVLDKCSIQFGPDTVFNFTGNPTVYWIVGYGTVTFKTGGNIEGTILASNGPIQGDQYGNSAAYISGRLWSNDSITLWGNTVEMPE